MESIILEQGSNGKLDVIALFDRSEIITNFDTGVTKVTISYSEGTSEDFQKLSDLRLSMGDLYISDMYGLRRTIQEDDKVKAALATAKKIFEDKNGVPYNFGSAICKTQQPIIYTPKNPDMQVVSN